MRPPFLESHALHLRAQRTLNGRSSFNPIEGPVRKRFPWGLLVAGLTFSLILWGILRG